MNAKALYRPMPGFADGRLLSSSIAKLTRNEAVHKGGRPILYVGPCGGDCGRYVARLG